MMIGAALALTLALAACSNDKPAQTDMKEASGESAQATEHVVKTFNTDDPNVVKIAVPTMQCETCANAISKAVAKVPSYEDVSVDVDNKSVFVKVSNNTPEVKTELETAISKAGYSTESVQRDAAAYENLPDCCKDGGGEK
jgi:copper chaperone CopZ